MFMNNIVLRNIQLAVKKIKGFRILADKSSTQITDVYAYVHLLLFLGNCRHTLLNIITRNTYNMQVTIKYMSEITKVMTADKFLQ